MKKIKISILTIVCILTVSFQQADNNSFVFSIKPPKNWIETTNNDILNNLYKYKLTEKELSKYISDHNGSVLLLSYLKYKQSEYSGLIPVIQVNIRRNQTNNFKDFFALMAKSAGDMKNFLQNFEYIDKPDTVLIDGEKAMYFSAKFTMNGKNGLEIKARSRTYAVPNGDKFFQINFTDGESDDCSKLFDESLKTIKLK